MLTFCRIVIALVFALSASGKVLDMPAFQESIADFRLLPRRWSKVVAWAFLGAEFVIALLMAVGGGALLTGFLLASGLLVTFSAALVVALRRNAEVTCNCFGRTERRISFYDVVRNALLVLCSLAGAWWALAGSPQNLAAVEAVLIGLMAVCFVVLTTNLRDIVETLRQPFHIG
jgi:uncharacterized membrane protein YphA (DoxX/SURF4 family)